MTNTIYPLLVSGKMGSLVGLINGTPDGCIPAGTLVMKIG